MCMTTEEMLFIMMCVIFSHILMWGVKILIKGIKTLIVKCGAKVLHAELRTIEKEELIKQAERLVNEK